MKSGIAWYPKPKNLKKNYSLEQINLLYFQLPTYLKREQVKPSALSIHGLLCLSSDLIF